MSSNGEQCSYKQLMTTEDFELYLMTHKPDEEWVNAHLDYVQDWVERLRNGGGKYGFELAKIGGGYLEKLRQGNPR